MILFNYFTSISASPLLINCQFQHNNLNLEKCFKCSARVAAWERGEGRGIWSRIQTQHLGCGTWEVLVLHSSTEHLLHFQHCSSQCWNCWRLCIGTISGGCLRSVLFLSSCWVWHFIHWLLFFTSFPGVHLPWAYCDHANLVLFSRVVFPCGKIWWGWKGEWWRWSVAQEPSLCLTASESPLPVIKEQ